MPITEEQLDHMVELTTEQFRAGNEAIRLRDLALEKAQQLPEFIEAQEYADKAVAASKACADYFGELDTGDDTMNVSEQIMNTIEAGDESGEFAQGIESVRREIESARFFMQQAAQES